MSEDNGIRSGPSMNGLRHWGHVVSIGVMVLAMFGFGLHFEQETNEDSGRDSLGQAEINSVKNETSAGIQGQEAKPETASGKDRTVANKSESKSRVRMTLNWKEIPAILIIFILAEFGVHLVVTSMAVVEKAESTLKKAEEVLKSIAELTGGSIVRASVLISTAEKLVATAIEAEQKLSETTTVQKQVLGNSFPQMQDRFLGEYGVASDDYWGNLGHFSKNWLGKGINSSRRGLSPAGHFFVRFCRDGTVRSTERGIAFITVGGAFVDAAREWLNTSIQLAKDSGKSVVVHAVTTLLPSELAVPRLWARTKEGADIASFLTIDKFVAEVIRACAGSMGTEGVYRRTTVLRDPGANGLDDAVAFRRTDEDKGGVTLSQLKVTLDNWFIRDGKLIQGVQAEAENLRRFASLDLGTAVRIKRIQSLRDLSRDTGETREESTEDPKGREFHILPFLDGPFLALLEGKGGEEKAAALFFANDDLLSRTINPRAIDVFFPHYNAGEEALTYREILRGFGWKSIREWYVGSLHLSPGAARVAIVGDGLDVSLMRQKWNGQEPTSLDVMMIGVRGGRSSIIEWNGAALANLSLNTPACIVELISEPKALSDLEIAIKTLESGRCYDWREFASGKEVG